MNIAIIGMGYVGVATAAGLLKQGHQVLGIEARKSRVEEIVLQPHFLEPDIAGVLNGNTNIHFSPDLALISNQTDLVMVCVGTPVDKFGASDLTAITKACRALAEHMDDRSNNWPVVIRSTLPPGTMDEIIEPIFGPDVPLFYNPEFLREGSSLQDYLNPSRIILGCTHEHPVPDLFREPATMLCSYAEAEMLKYADNAFHATKIVFANEIGQLCRQYGIDGQRVMQLVRADTKLNASAAYLRPGFAFGGSCLPKELRSIGKMMDDRDCLMPLLDGLLDSNAMMIDMAVDRIDAMELPFKRVGFYGFSFKSETPTTDCRESAVITMAMALEVLGFEVVAVDQHADAFKDDKTFDGWKITDHVPALLLCSVVIIHALPTSPADMLLLKALQVPVLDLSGRCPPVGPNFQSFL